MDPKKPQIPTLKDSKKSAPLKIKGLGGQTLMERLKTFKKKDLAFILAGLAVLFLAPLAEHFLMSPENNDQGAFKEGWGFRDSAGGLGKGGSPYEPGVNGMAPGGMAGGGTDVITPLNVRDPSALVMSPGATQQPPAGSQVAQNAPAKESSDWKDALANSAARGASAATHAALPTPKVPLSAGSLRGLGAVAGGGGASYSLPAISAAGVPNRGGETSHMGRVNAAPGYRGTAARGEDTGSGGSFEALKKAAAAAAGDFSRAGSAATNLENAASRQMPAGGSSDGGSGQQGAGAQDKGSSQNQDKSSKSLGESLEFLRQKMEQEKAIDLKWKLIEKQKMRLPNIEDKMFESALTKPWDKLTDQMADFAKLGNASKTYKCLQLDPDGSVSTRFAPDIPEGDIADTQYDTARDKDAKGGKPWYKCTLQNVSGKTLICPQSSDKPALACETIAAGKKTDQQGQHPGVSDAQGAGDVCKYYDNGMISKGGSYSNVMSGDLNAAKSIGSADSAFNGTATCGSQPGAGGGIAKGLDVTFAGIQEIYTAVANAYATDSKINEDVVAKLAAARGKMSTDPDGAVQDIAAIPGVEQTNLDAADKLLQPYLPGSDKWTKLKEALAGQKKQIDDAKSAIANAGATLTQTDALVKTAAVNDKDKANVGKVVDNHKKLGAESQALSGKLDGADKDVQHQQDLLNKLGQLMWPQGFDPQSKTPPGLALKAHYQNRFAILGGQQTPGSELPGTPMPIGTADQPNSLVFALQHQRPYPPPGSPALATMINNYLADDKPGMAVHKTIHDELNQENQVLVNPPVNNRTP